MLKWEGWFQTIYFDQEKIYIHTYEKLTKSKQCDKQGQFKEEELPLEL